MQSAQGGGVGEAVEHHTARARRNEDDRGCLGRVWWRGDHLNDAVAILHAPHRLFDPLHNALDAQPDRSGASSSALLVGCPATLLRAPQASTTPTCRSRQLPTATRADRRIGHDDTLPQFRTDETALSIRDLNARGVWFVGWSKRLGKRSAGEGAGGVGRVVLVGRGIGKRGRRTYVDGVMSAVVIEKCYVGVVWCGGGQDHPKSAARKMVREAQMRANQSRLEQERRNVDDAASFLVEPPA